MSDVRKVWYSEDYNALMALVEQEIARCGASSEHLISLGYLHMKLEAAKAESPSMLTAKGKS